MAEYCEAPGCGAEIKARDGKKRRFCDAHEKQMQRTGRLTAIRARRSPFGNFLEAAIALVEADAEDEGAYDAARVRARKAARVWVCSGCETCGKVANPRRWSGNGARSRRTAPAAG